jgi:hypothetical protein
LFLTPTHTFLLSSGTSSEIWFPYSAFSAFYLPLFSQLYMVLAIRLMTGARRAAKTIPGTTWCRTWFNTSIKFKSLERQPIVLLVVLIASPPIALFFVPIIIASGPNHGLGFGITDTICCSVFGLSSIHYQILALDIFTSSIYSRIDLIIGQFPG